MMSVPALLQHQFHIEDPSFDLERCVTSGQVFRWEELPAKRWIGIDGDAVFAVAVSGDGMDVWSNFGRARFERLFRLDEDYSGTISELIARGPELKPLVSAVFGLRLMRPSNPIETFFSFLCTPNNHIGRIKGMVGQLASFGEPAGTFEGRTIHNFPSLARLAQVSESELRERGFGYRASTIPRVACELSSRGGQGYLAELRTKGYECTIRELSSFYGIGPKLADCIALFALHFESAVPVDTHVWQAVVRFYRPEWKNQNLNASRYREAGEEIRLRFGPLAGWAQQFLFYENHLNWRERRIRVPKA
jgi:N-glycosylase/DNA lyase